MIVAQFVQPFMLYAIPLMAIPIVIHLINRQRHRTIAWGAMMFLLDAKRMTRGVARLRYWIIMAMRMAAIATLVIAIARPLASGRMGLALGGAPDTTIIVLDRSASMQQQDVETGETKRTASLRKLSDLLQTLGKAPHVVLIENVENRAQRIESPKALPQLPAVAATDTAADIPAMLQTALDYVVANQSGRTDVWLCSDMQADDWKAEDGRWVGLREGFAAQEGVRFYVLSYPESAPENLSVRVENARVGVDAQTTQLVLDVVVRRPTAQAEPVTVPLEFVINGARSVVNIDMADVEHRLQGHAVALGGRTRSGWGYVELPTDANEHDNRFYFVFGDAPQRHTLIVSDEPRVSRPMQIAAVSPVDPALSYTADVRTSSQLGDVDWEKVSLVLWQAPLPEGAAARSLSELVEDGRPVVFFPPRQPSNVSWAGFSWGEWEASDPEGPLQVKTWRGDSGLLEHAESGMPLPVGKLQLYRYCSIAGEGQTLATLSNEAPLLLRGTLGKGAFYFCATLPSAAESSMLRDGVTFYVMLHRALAAGAATRSRVEQLAAGTERATAVAEWELLSDLPAEALSSDRSLLASAFKQEDRLAALNRPLAEDGVARLSSETGAELFEGLSCRVVEEELGSTSALASEIWRWFVFMMAAALVVEAALCLPERKMANGSASEGDAAGPRQVELQT